ncbi:MAG: CDP-glycerol glycerophosphotransferase family protein [Firmicutes bacterium]|nr:CDP-glycerol glycerophosphotransferase family protein [Bacillota bacterium]
MELYIDPGTGSMLFTVLIGVIGAGAYALRMFWIKLRFFLSGGKAEINDTKIPIAIFSDDKRYWSVFAPLCRELNERGQEVVYLTASPDDPALENPYEHIKAEFIGKDNKAFAKLNFLKASILLSTTPGLDVYQWKRSRDVDHYIHIPHAASDITLYRMFGIDYYDSILLSGQYQVDDIRRLEEMRNLEEKELTIIGIPYLDEMAARLKAEGPAPSHPRTVLLAPSWGPSAIFSVYGETIIDVLLQTGYHIIIRPHPQSFKSEKEMIDRLLAKYPESDRLEWNRDNDNFSVLRRSAILISDFSGVIFDFCLVHDKPVIYTDPQFDVSPYDAWWLDTPLWTTGALPRLGRQLTEENMADLRSLIDSCLDDPSFAQSRREVINETWANRGEGAKRAADYLLTKLNSLTETAKEGK